ncbi:MAG TPA: DNA polymerase III subunit beta [Acidobacteriota bacterium]|nr:DNA polymerase III subunit beta [Acidobacteriota bacterium]
MEFVVEKAGFFKELQYVQGVVERKTTVPILSNILLEAEEGKLAVTATDLDVTVRCSCPASVSQGGSLAVSARKLFDMVRLLPEKPIHFASGDEGWINVVCDRSKFRVPGLSKENFPEVPTVDEDTVELPAGALRYMISHCIFAVTQEESRYSLNGALMLLDGTEMTFVTTDGHRLALVRKTLEESKSEDEVRILVPKKTLVELSKMSEEVERVQFGRTDNHLFFRLGERLLVSRVLTGQFPNYEMVIPRDNDRRAVIDRSAFEAAVKRVQVMADEQSRGVRFSLSEGELNISSASADYGEARESLPVQYEGEEVEIAFNATYLLDFLGSLGDEEVYLELRDSETQGLLRPKDEEDYDYRYVVMPMKI